MKGYICGYNFAEMEAMRYYAPPASWDENKKKLLPRSYIFSGDWIAAEKKDGFFAKFVKDEDGNMMLYSRSRNVAGEYINKIEWVPQLKEFFNELENGTCLLGELYFPEKPGSHNVTSIMGCLKEKAIARQELGPKLHYYVFDVLALNGESLLKTPIFDRIDYLTSGRRAYLNQYVEWAEYFEGEKLWNKLQLILASGGEGMVLLRKDGLYEPGKRPSKTTLKVKRELQESLDCFFTGRVTLPTRIYSGISLPSWEYWEDPITKEKLKGNHYREYMNGAPIEPVTKSYFNGMAGSLEIGVLRDGKVCPIGYLSGLSDEIKSNYKDYTGKCLEVGAMQFTDGNNALRHAKMIRLRPDLNIEDCTWEKLGL